MADYDTGGWQGVILPNAFGSPGDAIQARINNRNALTSRYGEALQRQQELDLREREMKQKQAEQYGLTNLRNLNENTDAQKLLLGDKYANDVTQQELKNVYDELVSKVYDVDPVTFDYLLHSKTNDFNNWHSRFKQDFDYAQQKTGDILKTNTNLNPDQAKEIVRSQLDDKYFKLGDDGRITRKPTEEVDERYDPTAILNDPRMQGQIAIGGQDVLKKYIQSQKLHQEDYSKYVSNKGFVNSDQYDIGVSGLQELSHDEHGQPVLKFKTEDMNLGGGIKLKMLPKATYDEMMSIPEVASAINKMWNPVAAKIEQNFAQQGNAIDAQSEEMLKRDFVRKQIQDNNLDLSYIQKKERDVVPRPPSVTISLGQQQKDQANELINNIVTSIRSGDEASLKQLTSYFKRGNTPFKLEEAFFVPGSNKQKVAIQYYILDDKGRKKLKEKYFQADDPYLRDKIIAEYQQDMGSTVPVEQLPYVAPNVAPIMQQQKSNNNSGKKKVYKGLDKDGNPIFE